ncbi:hypothetical protein Tco_1476358 [Tanacetum coccineum]
MVGAYRLEVCEEDMRRGYVLQLDKDMKSRSRQDTEKKVRTLSVIVEGMREKEKIHGSNKLPSMLKKFDAIQMSKMLAMLPRDSSRALRMFIEQSHDEVYGCLKGGSGNSGEKRLAISMVEEAWLSEKKEV